MTGRDRLAQLLSEAEASGRLPRGTRRDMGIRGPWFEEGSFDALRAEREHVAGFRTVCEQAWDRAPAADGRASRLRLLRSDPVLTALTTEARGRSRRISEAA